MPAGLFVQLPVAAIQPLGAAAPLDLDRAALLRLESARPLGAVIEASAAEVRAGQVGIGHPRPDQVGVAQVGASQVVVAEVDAGEIQPAEVCAAKVRAREEIRRGFAQRAALDAQQDLAGLFVPDLDLRGRHHESERAALRRVVPIIAGLVRAGSEVVRVDAAEQALAFGRHGGDQIVREVQPVPLGPN